ncbi:DNA topoisomerase IV subunit A [Engelhardtia mirabilis]|uniref:DNA topoisomerase (ATP-hydrolyzing) n=1 Tax=Engelhardtia mirabilis TaxID=2528011 RepID=A0A518BMU9_9BACT|nr:DNA topoisomerase VI subunit A [Planctomycetes bacterium Pla133]QDV02635.1 DNA topoisomerase VI subunit A [Planctomycetes bacterium Pla86]
MAKKKAAKKATKKTTSAKRADKGHDITATALGRTTDLDALDKKTLQLIESTARRVEVSINKRVLPELKFPIRSLSNVEYDKSVGHFELGKGRKSRALTVNTVRNFAQTLRLMAVSKEMVENDDFATKREAYYVSKNWGDAKFNEQSESDGVMDDIEALASLDGLSREQLRYFPEEHGGSLAGNLVVIDRDPETGAEIRIDCTAFGTGSYSIPHSVEHLEFETDAKFIIAIETGGMFQRLNNHKFWKSASCILIEMGGVPTRATRRFIRRLSDNKKLPVYCFVDCDPYGIANIYRTLKVGSGNAAHINRFFCVPQAQFLGVTPQDIIDFKLEDATHPLQTVDIKRAKDALKNDPFFKSHKEWIKAITALLKMGVRAEQQALAKWGLNFVIEEYLPKKLRDKKSFLP